jgi:hypothetical protein
LQVADLLAHLPPQARVEVRQRLCANNSPVAFCVTLTFTPVAFSNPMAMPWHHAVLGELQYIASVP